MTIHQGISSHMPTGKCLSLFSVNHNKSMLLFISSSNHNHIRNMNLKVFFRVVMRSGFQKILVFQINEHLKEEEHIYNPIIENIYVILSPF